MKKNYPINMYIPDAHLQMVGNKCTNFQRNLRTCVDKIMSTDGGQTDGQGETSITPHQTSFTGGINTYKSTVQETLVHAPTLWSEEISKRALLFP